MGKCNACNSWNSFVEEIVTEKPKSGNPFSSDAILRDVVMLDDILPLDNERISTPDEELNRVLGGGIVSGSVVLLGGEPGIGKSTILLQLALSCSQKILYIAGEESLNQIKLRATRLGYNNSECCFTTETGVEQIIQAAKVIKPDLLIVDSIQTIASLTVESTPGSVPQIRECTAALIQFAKKEHCAVFLIGHITKEGYIAGPKLLEHMVDTVLYFEGDRHYNYRILRSMKNRFGPAAEIGLYEMNEKGLQAIKNPSEILLTSRDEALSGIAIASTLEGIRPMLIELQALVSPSPYSTPQRTATGFDAKRLNMLLAVLEKRCGLKMNIYDVFVNIAGGIKVEDPAIDLAVITAMASSYNDVALPMEASFAGEIGLSGELRPVNQIEKRIAEAEKMGFKKFFLSTYNKKSITRKYKDIEIVYVDTVSRLLQKLF
jgi:DNA repair protein RadA/Sms